MNTFGEILRAFRQASNDPDRLKKRLSQERLGELIGHEMRDFGFSGAAVSDWERGKSRINAQDRSVLIALIRVLHRCSGIQTPSDADQLLEAGNYRVLDAAERQKIFGEIAEEEKKGTTESPVPLKELQKLISQAQEGPAPTWPRILAAWMRWVTDRISISKATLFWAWVWLGAWWLIGPSLRWPFVDRDAAVRAVVMFVGGTLAVPLCIGLLVNTKDDEYWKQQNGANPFWLRLYTYQGAGIGFNVGYFLAFPFVLARYYLKLESTVWIEVLAVTVSLILGNMAAHVVPHNLWRAYEQLTWKDGGIFFIVALLGPLWGFFYLEFHSILLAPVLGPVVILLAITMFVLLTVRQSKKRP